jgi:hypothetical protein
MEKGEEVRRGGEGERVDGRRGKERLEGRINRDSLFLY